jgi:hypothetical protein
MSEKRFCADTIAAGYDDLAEFLECRDNDRFDLLKNKLQQEIHRESTRVSQACSLAEVYADAITAVHIHGRITLESEFHWKFCATVERLRSSRPKAAGCSNTFMLQDFGNHNVKASVLVDVGELPEMSKGVINGTEVVVRLNLLDECKRLWRKPRKIEEFGLRARRVLSPLEGLPDRKFALLFPVELDDIRSGIRLDEIEHEVIQCRPQLIDHFASQQRNLGGRGLPKCELYCAFALRFGDHIRACGCVIGNATLDGFEVLSCPGDLQPRRRNTCHTS